MLSIRKGSGRNRTHRTYAERKVHLKDLAHEIVGAAKSKLHEAGGVDLVTLRLNSFFPGKPLFPLFRPSADWTRPTHVMAGICFI